MNKELNVILREMEDAKSDEDTENSHVTTDSLLIKTIELLSKKATRAEKEKINKIIKTYNKTKRWYA